MFTWIDSVLNRITMYRLVLYYLLALCAVAFVLSFLGILPYNPFALLFTGLFFTAICWVANGVFAEVFAVPANAESIYITALILTLIITPVHTWADIPSMIWVGVWAMASKYMFAVRKKHIFNPAAFAVAVTALTLGYAATWWVGTPSMLPYVLIGGVLIIRKILRWDLAASFVIGALSAIAFFTLLRGGNVFLDMERAVLSSSLFFFAFIMITEPLTTPPTRKNRILYGTLTGLLFAPQVHIGPIYSTPELALLVGNVFSYLVSPKFREVLRLKKVLSISPDTGDFIFESDRKMKFQPGQYLEWTLGHSHPDGRGNRRYFTIASSPTEEDIRIGVKFYSPTSSFKHSLTQIVPGRTLVASQLAGEFVMPKDEGVKLVFIAGGIGITPFRSMVKYLTDMRQQRHVTLLYSNKKAEDIVYTDIFDAAEKQIGLKAVYTLTDTASISPQWTGRRGMFTAEVIQEEVPDYAERLFYISGPHTMVVAFQKALRQLGVNKKNIITDFFPGFV